MIEQSEVSTAHRCNRQHRGSFWSFTSSMKRAHCEPRESPLLNLQEKYFCRLMQNAHSGELGSTTKS